MLYQSKNTSLKYLFGIPGILLTLNIPIYAANHDVSSETELGTAITNATTGDTITFQKDISLLTTTLPTINSDMTFIGNGYTIDGNNSNRVFFVNSGTVSFSNLTIQNGLAQGGNGGNGDSGGGGAAGMGGGLFINDGSNVTVTNVTFHNNQAIGGDGGNHDDSISGGGGGGGDANSDGTDSSGDGTTNCGLGPCYGGGNGGGTTGGTGGLGSNTTADDGNDGSNVGDGGGGGGGGATGGNGGDGNVGGGAGGGGEAGNATGGTGGNSEFGGGGGGGGGCSIIFSCSISNSAGIDNGSLGGNGGLGIKDASGGGGGGGGGAGLGGAIFVSNGANLTLNNVAFINNSATGGTGGTGVNGNGNDGTDGQGKGGAIFVHSSATATVTGTCITHSGNSATDDTSITGDDDNVYGSINENACTTAYKLTLNTNGNGTVTQNPSGTDCGTNCFQYTTGTSISLTPTANNNYVFNGWTETGCADSFTITADMTCTANFIEEQTEEEQTEEEQTEEEQTEEEQTDEEQTDDEETDDEETESSSNRRGMEPLPREMYVFVEIAGSGSGRVTSEPLGIDCETADCTRIDYQRDMTGVECDPDYCAHPFQTTDYVILNAIPDEGSLFVGWGGHPDCADDEIWMIGNKLCLAFFQKSQPLTVGLAGDGKGNIQSSPTGIDCGNGGSICVEEFRQNSTVNLTAKPATGSRFAGWQGACEGPTLRTRVKMDTAKECTAYFVVSP
jgi:hypothetical protein